MNHFKCICDNMDCPIILWKISKNDVVAIYVNKKSSIKLNTRFITTHPNMSLPKNDTEIYDNNIKINFIFLDKTTFYETHTFIDNTIFILEALNQKIRGPLTNISGVSEILSGNVSKNDLRKYLKILRISSSDILQVALNLTYLINLIKKNIKINNDKIMIDALINKCIKLSSINITRNEKNINIQKVIHNINFINSDNELLEYIIISILDFMIDNIESGNIIITANYENNNVVIKLKDVGNGLDEEQINNVKLILNNGNINIKSYKCFGLCLYISKIMADLIGIKISFDSKKEFGTIFQLHIFNNK